MDEEPLGDDALDRSRFRLGQKPLLLKEVVEVASDVPVLVHEPVYHTRCSRQDRLVQGKRWLHVDGRKTLTSLAYRLRARLRRTSRRRPSR